MRTSKGVGGRLTLDFFFGGVVLKLLEYFFDFLRIDAAALVEVEHGEGVLQELVVLLLVAHALVEELLEIVEAHGGLSVGKAPR